jgi:hypothetical protein
MRIKSFKLFESSEDVNYIISTVKDMLLELNFLDIESRCELLKSRAKIAYVKKSGQYQYLDIIVINLWKKAIITHAMQSTDYSGLRSALITTKASYNWDDVKSVMEPIFEYLESEGFKYQLDQGTLAYNGVPIVSTSGSYQFDTIRTKIEMWFIR